MVVVLWFRLSLLKWKISDSGEKNVKHEKLFFQLKKEKCFAPSLLATCKNRGIKVFNYVKLRVGAVKCRADETKFKCQSVWRKRGISENLRFSENFDFLKDWSGFCYTSPPRGNQVGDLPRALICGGLALICDFRWKKYC